MTHKHQEMFLNHDIQYKGRSQQKLPSWQPFHQKRLMDNILAQTEWATDVTLFLILTGFNLINLLRRKNGNPLHTILTRENSMDKVNL